MDDINLSDCSQNPRELLELDADCLHAICDYLEVKDLVLFSHVCKELMCFIEDRLQRRCKKITFLSEFWRTKENEVFLPRLLKLTVGTLEHVQIPGSLIISNMNWLEALTFEKVTKLYISLRKSNDDVRIVIDYAAKLFPNVYKISLSGENLDVAINELIPRLPNIREMNLYDMCYGYNVDQMKNLQSLFIHTGKNHFEVRLLSALARAPELTSLTYLRNYGAPQQLGDVYNVERLQELTIHNLDFENLKRANIFKQMKSLRKITTYEYPLFYTINLEDKCFYRRIEGFSITRRYSTDVKLVVEAPKLRRIWFNRECNILPYFCNDAGEPLHNLEELYYIYCRAVAETQRNVMNVVARSPKLRLLDISGSKFKIDFVENLLQILNWKNRDKVLLLRCHNTQITMKELQCLELPQNLKVSFEKLRYDLPTRNTINFQIYLSDQTPFYH